MNDATRAPYDGSQWRREWVLLAARHRRFLDSLAAKLGLSSHGAALRWVLDAEVAADRGATIPPDVASLPSSPGAP